MKKFYVLSLIFLFSLGSKSQIQLGINIDGETVGDESGCAVSLDGNRVAIGADGSNTNTGHVQVYSFCSSGENTDTKIQSVALDDKRYISNTLNTSYKAEFKVYPNPTYNILHIETQESENVELILFDQLGRVLHTQQLQQKLEIVDLNKFTAGIYSLSITNNKKIVYQKTSHKNAT
ncbi:MAG: T9SS type A sorting domain-containing protein [Aureispira sp.]|nr:T9SS type A sorting domain-containing protein [Aureispira sp.]